MIEEFYEFLKMRCILETYLSECCSGASIVTYDDVRLFLTGINPKDYIIQSFLLNYTYKGMDFWSEVHADWLNYLKYWEEDLGEEWYLKK